MVAFALAELAAFIVRYCNSRSEAYGASCQAAVTAILASPAFPDQPDRQAMLYGYATEIGAREADGFDLAWKPAGCV